MSVHETDIHDIHLQFLKIVDEQLAGLFRSAFKGHGYELAEIRKYAPGDEIRMIDWNVTARTGDLYIRQNLEDKELSVFILVDASASGLVHSLESSKQSVINKLATLLTMLCVRNRDQVSIIKFTDEIEGYLPPSKTASQSIKAIDLLYKKTSNSRKTSIKTALQHLISLEKKNALVFLLSDFMDSNYQEELELVSELHDLICLQVSDPLDEALPNVGLIEMNAIESGTSGIINTSNRKLLKKINRSLREQQDKLHRMLLDVNCEHLKLNANDDAVISLKHFFSQRKKGRNHVGA
ncbi:DUF58 domain-containing protein [Saccharicrinis aurantiacus]|uniref:DUF58 domain-containing protein n=1 Tax=Saccharicrinis aurantiacus TaxID=1849719 RepID=UPI00248FE683|nr:DUF58 domain-containing protein [Saccharicrinis aurantiacus]